MFLEERHHNGRDSSAVRVLHRYVTVPAASDLRQANAGRVATVAIRRRDELNSPRHYHAPQLSRQIGARLRSDVVAEDDRDGDLGETLEVVVGDDNRSDSQAGRLILGGDV